MEKQNLNAAKRSRFPLLPVVAIGFGAMAFISSVLTFLSFGEEQEEIINME